MRQRWREAEAWEHTTITAAWTGVFQPSVDTDPVPPRAVQARVRRDLEGVEDLFADPDLRHVALEVTVDLAVVLARRGEPAGMGAVASRRR